MVCVEGEAARAAEFGNIKCATQTKYSKYPIGREKMVTRHLAPNSQTVAENSIFTGQLPRRVAVVMIVYRLEKSISSRTLYCFEIALKYGDEYVPR